MGRDVNRSVAFGTLALFVAGLAGCSSSPISSTSDWFPSIPGFSSVRATSADRSAMAAESPPSVDEDCPTIDIRQGASSLAIATRTQQPTASDLRYQLTLTEFARQCALDGPT